MKRRLLWIGDAGCDSGFAKCTHFTLAGLTDRYEIEVIGINFRGDPHGYPYHITPAWSGGDILGLGRCQAVVERFRPDIIVIQNDPWHFPRYQEKLAPYGVPTMGIVAVDGLNCAGHYLNWLARAVFWTEFGREEAKLGGMRVPSGVVPLGVDLETFNDDVSRDEARETLVLPPDIRSGFLVGNLNRNQPRKRMDLTIRYFCRWVKDHNIEDAFLYLHVAPTGDHGYNCLQLMRYYGLGDRLIVAEPDVWQGVSDRMVARTLRALDVYFTTTQGEGWGLPALEAMACGTPVLAPDWSALGEWAREAAFLVPCTGTGMSTPKVGAIGGIMDEGLAVDALQALYESPALRSGFAEAGLHRAREQRFRWETISEGIGAEIEEALSGAQRGAGVQGANSGSPR